MIKGDPSPAFVPLTSPGGLYICTRRKVADERYFWRGTPFLMPCFNLFPPYGDNPCGGDPPGPAGGQPFWGFRLASPPRPAPTPAGRPRAQKGARARRAPHP